MCGRGVCCSGVWGQLCCTDMYAYGGSVCCAGVYAYVDSVCCAGAYGGGVCCAGVYAYGGSVCYSGVYMGAVCVVQVCMWGRCMLCRCVCVEMVYDAQVGGSYVAQVCMHKEGSIHCSGVYGGGVCCSAVCGSHACFTSCSPVSTLVGRKSLSTQLCNTSSFSFETGASLNLETDWYQQHRNPHLVSTLRITRTAEREMAGL